MVTSVVHPTGALYDEAAEVVNTLWPKGNESWKEVGQYFFVVAVLSAL
ncbi:conserved hypothetical protein [Vibrio crassostreae]|nr:hypothetical protein [Vibrio lentus]CAK2649946.1 conserved hypothetical protein [Vibrio crassostreae]CAK3216881.1 conserved hypothetical protein [Vibrio crassostreae]